MAGNMCSVKIFGKIKRRVAREFRPVTEFKLLFQQTNEFLPAFIRNGIDRLFRPAAAFFAVGMRRLRAFTAHFVPVGNVFSHNAGVQDIIKLRLFEQVLLQDQFPYGNVLSQRTFCYFC
jgi:hypothetical protein